MATGKRILLTGLMFTAAVLCGCSTRTYVTATGSTPPQYTHVYITVKELWFNSSSTAQPDDGGWSKSTLSEPVTIDLVTTSNGTLTKLTGGLRLVPGTYAQIRIIPVDNTTLTTSAKAMGATYNNEVDYVDTVSVSHQLPLEILNPDIGIGAQGSLKVVVGGGSGASVAAGATNSTSALGLGTNGSTTVVNFTLNFNAATDIALFTYGSQQAAVLNSHVRAYDLSKCGGISGTLTLTNIGNITNSSTRLNLSATAETLSADGSRHVVVVSSPVHSDGTFLLYPLPANDSQKNPTAYDIVIHGAGIQTIIIKGVQVARSSTSSSSSSSASSGVSVGTASVSVGTLIPQSASSYRINLAAATALPAGSIVAMYQTLPGTGEVPYVIEHSAIDPFNKTMQTDVPVSVANVQMSTYAAGGQALTLTSATPVEGAGSYTVAASATAFSDGALNTTVSMPTTGTLSLTSPSTLSVASGASSVSMTARVTQTSAGAYNRGQLIISRDGAIIATTSLDAALAVATGADVTVPSLPGGSASVPFATGLYDVSVRVWNAADPVNTLQHQSFPAAVDVRYGSVSGVSIAIN